MARQYRVLISLDQPPLEKELITIGAAVARRKRGEAVALNVLLRSRHDTFPPDSGKTRSLVDEQSRLLQEACRHTREMGITVTPVILLSARVQESILQEAKERGVNLILMGWNKPTRTPGAVMGSILDRVAARAPANIAVFRNRGLKDHRVLLSTAGGPDSHLGGQIAAALQQTAGASITLLHLVKSRDKMDQGRAVLEEFAKKHNLKARRILKAREDFTAGILEESRFHDLIVIGGSRTGLFPRIFFRTIPQRVVEQAECSVLVTLRQGPLPFMTRFFGARKP